MKKCNCDCGWSYNLCTAKTGVVLDDTPNPYSLEDPHYDDVPWPHEVGMPEEDKELTPDEVKQYAWNWGDALAEMGPIVHTLLAHIHTLNDEAMEWPLLLSCRIQATVALRSLGAHNPFNIPASILDLLATMEKLSMHRDTVRLVLVNIANQGVDADATAAGVASYLRLHGHRPFCTFDDYGQLRNLEEERDYLINQLKEYDSAGCHKMLEEVDLLVTGNVGTN